MKDRKFFSEQIRLWRIGKGLSLTKASKRFGISPRTFSNWERGLIPSDRQKERLSKELGLDRDVLFKKCEIGNLNALLKEKTFGTRTYSYRISKAFRVFFNNHKLLGERFGNIRLRGRRHLYFLWD